MSGLFIAVEGPDGSGKSTGIKYLKQVAERYKEDVVFTREPGGTAAAEEIRKTLLSIPMHNLSEVLMFVAGRADHFFNVIKPTVDNGGVVITDRYMDSTYAYQAYGRDMLDMVESAHGLFEKQANKEGAGIHPDIILFFDIPFDLSQARIGKRNEALDVFERERYDFFKKVFEGYKARMDFRRNQPGCTVYTIDATQSIEGVQKQLLEFFTYLVIHRKRK